MTEPAQATDTAPAPPTIVPDPLPELARGERERPPARRRSETITVEICGVKCYFIAGFHSDGSLCEAFIETGKAGSGIRGWATAFSLVVSHYIQIGGSVETIAGKLRHINFEPSGAVQDAPLGIEKASSMIDAFAQFLLAYKDGAPPIDTRE